MHHIISLIDQALRQGTEIATITAISCMASIQRFIPKNNGTEQMAAVNVVHLLCTWLQGSHQTTGNLNGFQVYLTKTFHICDQILKNRPMLSHLILFIFLFISYYQNGTTGLLSGQINYKQLELLFKHGKYFRSMYMFVKTANALS